MLPKYTNAVHLIITAEWYDLILSGEKKEEYREIKPYWTRRLIGNWHQHTHDQPILPGPQIMPYGKDVIIFRNGYRTDSRAMMVEWEGVQIGFPKPKWCPENTKLQVPVYVLKLGKILWIKE